MSFERGTFFLSRFFIWAAVSVFRSRFRRGGELHSSRAAGLHSILNMT